MMRLLKRTALLLSVGLWSALPLVASEDEGRRKVAEGIRLFANGDHAAAERAFAEADVLLPENARIAYDRACALEAQGDLDRAVDLYTRAALSRETAVAAAARYNLGTLNVKRAMGVFGESPEAAPPEVREEGLGHLGRAVRHFRDCLDVDTDHQNARHNLEGIRIWIKHMTALWEEADRQKKRDELDVLKFLEMIQETQLQIREGVRQIAGQPDSPRRREAVGVAESDQRKLQEEIEYLKEKITEVLAPPQPPQGQTPAQPQPDQEQIDKALTMLKGWADESAAKMTDAADSLAGGIPESAPLAQIEAVERLDRVYGALAPFPMILEKSIVTETGLIEKTGPLAEGSDGSGSDEEPGQPGGPDDQEAGTDLASTADWIGMSVFQDRITSLAEVLPYKADQAEQQADQGMADFVAQHGQTAAQHGQTAAQQGQDPNTQTTTPEQAEALKKAQEEVEAVKAALAKARELAPEIIRLSEEAARFLRDEAAPDALSKEEEVLALLREIADLMPKKDQEQQQQDQNDQNDQNKEQQKEQQEQQKKRNEEEKQKQISKDEAEALLRKAKERERKHKKDKEELQKVVGGRAPTGKDW